MIEIEEGIFVDPWSVTLIKAAGKKQCVLYVTGQSAMDGFLIERNALEVATEICDAKNEAEEDDEDEVEDE